MYSLVVQYYPRFLEIRGWSKTTYVKPHQAANPQFLKIVITFVIHKNAFLYSFKKHRFGFPKLKVKTYTGVLTFWLTLCSDVAWRSI